MKKFGTEDLDKLWGDDTPDKRFIKVNIEESMLLDYILTMHNFSEEYMKFLMHEDFQNLREQAGKAILNSGGEISLKEDLVKQLLVLVPITFIFLKEDVGFSLKIKLYQIILGE